MAQVSADSLCQVIGPSQWRAHATCVALGDNGVLILGQSGSGKSSLAAEMIALGCSLVADDAVVLTSAPPFASVTCSAPDSAPECLEMRGFGLLPLPLQASASLSCSILLSASRPPRFPQEETIVFEATRIPFYRPQYQPGLAAKVLLLLRQGGYCRSA